MDPKWRPLKYYEPPEEASDEPRRILFVQHEDTLWIRKINLRDGLSLPTYHENPKYLEYYSHDEGRVVARYPQVGDTVYWEGDGLKFGECIKELRGEAHDEMEVLFRGEERPRRVSLEDLVVVWHNIEGMQARDTERLRASCHGSARTVEEIHYAFTLYRTQTLEWMLRDETLLERPMNLELICELHDRIFGPVVSWGGRFREIELVVGRQNWATPPWREIPQLMEEFTRVVIPEVIETLELPSIHGEGVLDTRKCSALAKLYHELCEIHPFRDGNGRISRLLLQLITLRTNHGVMFHWERIKRFGNTTDRAFEEARSAKKFGESSSLRALAQIIRRAAATF